MTTTTTPGADRSLVTDEGPGVFVSTSWGDVHVKIDGDPSARVVAAFIHGLPGSTRDFGAAAQALARRGGCSVRLDLPGFGRSPTATRSLVRAEERAALVVEVMRARGHRRFAVVGHSFGGTAALAAAATSTSVSAVALVASVGVTRHRGLSLPHEITGALAGLWGVPVVGTRLAAPLVEGFRRTMARVGVRSERPFSDAELVGQAEIIGGLDFADLRRFAAAVVAPALVLSAEDDRIVDSHVSFTLAAALTRSSLVTHHHRQQAGHFLQKRHGDVIADWLIAVA